MVVTLFKKPHFWTSRDEIELSDYPETEDDIKFEFNIKDALRIGFLRDLQKKGKDDPNFVQLKASKMKNLEKELKEEMKERGLDTTEEDEEEKRFILILIEKNNRVIPLSIDLELNTNKAYNDYLIALAQGKTLVMREPTKESNSV